MTAKKKLIEVALPLEAINKASAREKSIRHGHPSTLHLWWARRPLAAARAVIFAQMVDDPSAYPDKFPTEEAQEKERQRLFRLIEELVQWENTTNETVLAQARDEIWKSWRSTCAENKDHPRAADLFNPDKLPAFHDPFAGGGSLPLEAQRLGLESYASDLNPVAVLINKAMIEIPPKFAGRPPVNPESRKEKTLLQKTWRGAQGLAEDVRYYGRWMRDEAEKHIGHLYPKIEITAEMAKSRPDLKPLVGRNLTVIAWLWARTVKSPNPAFTHVDVPLVASFILATKPGKEVYVEPVIEDGSYRFTVKVGKPRAVEGVKNGTKLARGANFRCLMSGSPMAGDYIKTEGKAGRMGTRLMAIVAEGERGRVYLSPTPEHEAVARQARPAWEPEGTLVEDPRAFTLVLYNLKEWRNLFTPRQLVALSTLSDLVQVVREKVQRDALAARLSNDVGGLNAGGTGALAYAGAVSTYLSLAVGRVSDYCSTICTWASNPQMEIVRGTFARQALPMTWDFAEANLFGPSTGSLEILIGWVGKVIERLPAHGIAMAQQHDATLPPAIPSAVMVSTDPPYYDNVPYADLSDFFYVWLRHSLKPIFPDLFATLAVPKAEELVASPYRHGGKKGAEAFFLDGMTRAMHRLADQAHPGFPVTIYYAFKQSETESEAGTASTGWETFLGAVIRAGFAIGGTWPMRTERANRSRGIDSNALASSIVLVCRPRREDAPTATRREFLTALKRELPEALARLQHSNIAPVDLQPSAIGPGMAVFTRYARVLDAEGKAMRVREALALINQTLDEVLAEQEGDFDADSRWALSWFEQFGFADGEYGVAETLSKAKNTSVGGMVEAGILASKGGKVHLFKPAELPPDWNPATDLRLTAWEMVHHLIRSLEAGGETEAAALVAKLGSKAETARELCYRLYTLCERKKRAQEALSYNGLVQSFPEITRLAREGSKPQPFQAQLFEQE
jgi:putative DNA methylase